MNEQSKESNWNGFEKLLIPLGHKADVNNLTTLASFLVDKDKGNIEFIHVIVEGGYSDLPREWRVGSKRVVESHHMMMKKGIQSEKKILTADSIEKGILKEAANKDMDAIILGWGPKPKSSISKLASKIMNKANCDVIIYKTRKELEKMQKIIYPVAAEPNRERLQIIKKIMNSTNSSLTFAHIIKNSSYTKKEAKELLDIALNKARKLDIEADILLRDANNVIEELADISKDFDLMVLGPSGGWWLTKTLFGHKTDKIAVSSHCSILLHKYF